MANPQAPEAPHTAIPSATEFLARFSDAEPNDPGRPGGTLSDLLDELGDAFVVYGHAFTAAAATLRRHQPRLWVEAADLDAVGSSLTQAGWACRQLGPNLRGFLPPLPWLPEDADVPPRAGDDEPGEPTEDEFADTSKPQPGDESNDDVRADGENSDDASAEASDGGSS